MSANICDGQWAWSEVVVVLQDDNYLYLVMEYLAGGDVMVRLQQALLRWSLGMSPHVFECCNISC